MSEIFSPLPERISLSAFTRRIAYLVNGRNEVTNIWVIAEITDFSQRGNGHGYCTLIEKDPAGNSIASLRTTIWQNDLRLIRQKFLAATGQNFASGMKVSLCISASMHPLYGLSANVRDIDPSYSLGDMERIRREILALLQKEGIYDANRTVPLPPAPQRIAIISAENAAGYGDFMRQLNSSPFSFYTLLYPAVMQGLNTVPTVMQALDRIEETVDFWDCVIIIRGGGATNDLNSFDNLELARRVATYPLPVIVGIGHERDNTVLDFIANTRCKTPTAVATFLIDRLSDCMTRAEDLLRKITDNARIMIGTEKEHLSYFEATIPLLAPRHLAAQKERLSLLQTILAHSAAKAVLNANRILNEVSRRLSALTGQQIERNYSKLDSFLNLLRQASSQRIKLAYINLENNKRLIELLSPEATLKRGYSITRINGKALRSVRDIRAGERISTQIADGEFDADVV